MHGGRRMVVGMGLGVGLLLCGCPEKKEQAPKESPASADRPQSAKPEEPHRPADTQAAAPKAADPEPRAEREPPGGEACKTLSPIYPTKGVHSPCYCGPDECVEKRAPSDPPDPRYPDHWVSRWNMFRVHAGYQNNLPPYADPPAGLEPKRDYELTHGITYYDDGYTPTDGNGRGAMMEHYEKYCLPIFPIDSRFTCSFISLGNKAYFLTYDEDRPKDMPPCCFFSPYNHPPRPDFIKHLPYSPEDSTHVGDKLQAYRYIAKGPDGEDIWFAYAFWRDQWLDPEHEFLKPQSFYFSGSPTKPPNAPFVSQNYIDFRIEKPDPAQTWELVAKMCPADPPPCHLFDPPDSAEPEAKKNAPTVGAEAPAKGAGWNNANFDGEEKP